MKNNQKNTTSHIITSPSRVLILEDDHRWSQEISSVMVQRGLSVDIASTFEEATRLLRAGEYDVAVLDLQLTERTEATGLDIAKTLRERNPESLVIVLTGYASTSDLRNALRIGVDEVLDKADFSLDHINKALDAVLLRRETERESIRRTQIDRLMYETLSMMSHELRTPLIIIKRNVEALLSGAFGSLKSDQIEAVKEIQLAAQRELLLINAYLDLNRIERGVENLTYQEYDLVKLVREEVAAHRAIANLKNIKFEEFLPEGDAIVRIDVNRFRVALNPLMDNAIKFSPEGGHISVRVSLTSNFVEVQIEDQGPGMKPDEIDRIINLQFMESSSFTQRFRSSGLGLSVAKRMISLHGGKLWIESDGKSGTRVNFRLSVNS